MGTVYVDSNGEATRRILMAGSSKGWKKTAGDGKSVPPPKHVPTRATQPHAPSRGYARSSLRKGR